MKGIWLPIALTALLIAFGLGSARAQEGGLLGGRVRQRLQTMREHMTNKNPNIQYDPAVLRPGTPRSQVEATFGPPNGTQNVGGVQEDVYAFFPDGSKYVDPQITAGTVAAAVFTGGMSLAVKAAKNTIEQNQLTLYDVRYDSNQNVQSVKVIPPAVGSQPGGAVTPQAGGSAPNANY